MILAFAVIILAENSVPSPSPSTARTSDRIRLRPAWPVQRASASSCQRRRAAAPS
ncbi:hypothetical protein EBBID32_7050 [Sphingobium indicum BiD32]|uniref:Uncharacterized protein n=1 Tax=Sphingobium indicum BiD32 TaxID=1301087 RepID=N1MHV5_9SPHN|nr:hypothetical protein EBBID32_7050 [Sphingobium indicum BiD32]